MSGAKDLGGLLQQSLPPITDNMLVQQARSAIRAPVLSTPRAQSFLGAVDSFNKSLDDYSGALAEGIAKLRHDRLTPDLDLSPPEPIHIEAPRRSAPLAKPVSRTDSLSAPSSPVPLGALLEQKPLAVPQQEKKKPSLENLVAQALLQTTRVQPSAPPKVIPLPKPRYL